MGIQQTEIWLADRDGASSDCDRGDVLVIAPLIWEYEKRLHLQFQKVPGVGHRYTLATDQIS